MAALEPPPPSPPRCAQDMVEVPSHLWEHFAVDPSTLALLARHRSVTREPLPEEVGQQLVHARRMFSALELQGQCCWRSWIRCELRAKRTDCLALIGSGGEGREAAAPGRQPMLTADQLVMPSQTVTSGGGWEQRRWGPWRSERRQGTPGTNA